MHAPAFVHASFGILALALLALPCQLPSLVAQDLAFGDGDETAGQQWAILIGVENYQKATPLTYTMNDVDQLAATLRDRGGVPSERVIKFVETAPDSRFQPLKASLIEQLPRYLRKPKAKDRLIVYFSGHGFRSQDGNLFLAPIDCDPTNPAATGISVSWLKDQIAACPAQFKLLVLDSCHAGTEKGEELIKGASAKDLGEPFRDLEGVVTLASSTGDEKSQIWVEKRQSLFTYWLNQGLAGHADENGDAEVDIDELNKYVHKNVTHTAKSQLHRPQTPVRIIRGGSGTPVVLELVPTKLKYLINDMAQQMAWSMQERGLKKVGVLQFTTDTPLGEALGGGFGSLGRWCTAELEKTLLQSGTCEVIDSTRLIAALKKQKFTVDQLGSPEALQQLSKELGGMPAIVMGTLRHRQNKTITLQCKLQNIETESLVGAAGGSALLNENEWAMLGHSVAIKPEDRPPPVPGNSDNSGELIQKLDEKATAPHPMRDPKFPYRVAIMVNGKERVGEFRGNEYVIPLRNGEVYEIWVRILNNESCCVKVLVDGLNTLPQKLRAEKGISTVEVAPIAKLDEAREWMMDVTQNPQRVWAIRGFVTETGAAGKLRRFVVTDPAQSLAAQKNFTESMGMITAAFYTPTAVRGGTTVQPWETPEVLTERRDTRAGDLISVVHIRYLDADKFHAGK
ncbi:Caspase domain protein [Anatilimnocola aggregata]|uniref:Caspase domain protein n=1 Tax=Anatilimnocola aggregata TaxID=2528021 RepID=A0A517Y4B3_9BACT|nr:caspase family protein [Anatilimnocola aggregata]QDU25098.1 Caspase domain protein [Anatilimnocola aggregata]